METDILAVGRLKRFQNYKCGREFVLNEKIYFLKRYGNIRKGPKANGFPMLISLLISIHLS